jgi:hypothetical protein
MALYCQWIADEVPMIQRNLERHAEVFGEMRESLQDAMCREVLAEMVATGVAQHLTLQQGPEGMV